MLVSFSGMIFIWNYMRVGEFGSKFTSITKKETDGHTHTHTHTHALTYGYGGIFVHRKEF